MESIQKFLVSGEGKFFMDDRYRRTMTVKSQPRFNFAIVDDVVNRALAGTPVVAVINEFQMYVAAADGEPDYKEAFQELSDWLLAWLKSEKTDQELKDYAAAECDKLRAAAMEPGDVR